MPLKSIMKFEKDGELSEEVGKARNMWGRNKDVYADTQFYAPFSLVFELEEGNVVLEIYPGRVSVENRGDYIRGRYPEREDWKRLYEFGLKVIDALKIRRLNNSLELCVYKLNPESDEMIDIDVREEMDSFVKDLISKLDDDSALESKVVLDVKRRDAIAYGKTYELPEDFWERVYKAGIGNLNDELISVN